MVTFSDIQQARERIAPIARRTPVLTSRTFNTLTGTTAFFKAENFQRGGAFKIRGASNFVLSLTDEERRRGLVAFSSGNHAQAVAIAAKETGAKATIVMPEDAPKLKLAATRAQGANVITYDRFTGDREAIGRKIADETGAILVPPYDDERIIAGGGTAVAELIEEVKDLDTLVVCVGGGGLMSGSAIAAKALNPSIKVYAAEPELANDTWQSFRKGERVGIGTTSETIADGLRSPMPGALTFPIMRELVEDVITVTEDEIREAVRFLLFRMKILVEPSGAVPTAAVLAKKLPGTPGRTGILISGGNVDPDQLASIIGG